LQSYVITGSTRASHTDVRDETHFVFPLEQPYDINHLTVFLLGTSESFVPAVLLVIAKRASEQGLTDFSPISRGLRRFGALRMAKCSLTGHCQTNHSLTNNKPSAIYRLRPHLPANIPQGQSTPATLGIEIAPLPQLEELHARISGSASGSGADGSNGSSGKEVVQKVEVGKVAEKVVKNVSAWLSWLNLVYWR
jgi:hypothetical protein